MDGGIDYSGENLQSELLDPKLAPSLKEQLQQVVTEYGYERTTIFDGVTGDVWTYQHGSSVPGANMPSEFPVAAARVAYPGRVRRLAHQPRETAGPAGQPGDRRLGWARCSRTG